LREDNAFERLGKYAHKLNLISDPDFSRINKFFEFRQKLIATLNTEKVKFEGKTFTYSQLLKRPEINIQRLVKLSEKNSNNFTFPSMTNSDISYIEANIKYEGYIKLQENKVKKMEMLKKTPLPEDINYFKISGLSTEIREKLSQTRPKDLHEANLISGITPASINAISIYLTIRKRKQKL
jgi:tRNA uridine 5-carboxymethylaminomethyl modification enzyme